MQTWAPAAVCPGQAAGGTGTHVWAQQLLTQAPANAEQEMCPVMFPDVEDGQGRNLRRSHLSVL